MWWEPIRRRRASAYGAGPRLDQALDVCRRLATYGVASAIGYAANRGESARAVADIHLAAIDRLSAEGTDCYVSIKLSALGFDEALFAELTSAAWRSGTRLHLDALSPGSAEATLLLLERASHPARLGTTLPGRWHRSMDDLSRIMELGVSVRVVKGQWPDDLDPMADPTKGFREIVERLQGYAAGVAVATHDVTLLRASLAGLTASRTPCTSELFLGMPFRGPAIVARQLEVPVRVYVPYGDTGAPYRLGGHPAAAWWLLQDLALGQDKTWRSIRRSRM